MERGENIGALAQELGICVSRLYEWRKIYQLYGDVSLRVIACPPGRKILVAPSDVREDAEYGSVGAESGGLAGLAAAKRRITELERKIGQQELDIDFFRQALRRVGAKRRLSGGNGGTGSTKSFKP